MTVPELVPSSCTTPDSHWKDRLGSWKVYAAAVGATLATASSAEANIIYTHPASPVEAHLMFLPSGGLTTQYVIVPFGLNGINAFLELNWIPYHSVHRDTAWLGVTDRRAKFFLQGQIDLYRFPQGAPIKGGRSYGGLVPRSGGIAQAFIHSVPRGNFRFSSPGFAGFSTVGGDLGWIRIEVFDRNHDGFVDAIEAIDWAYNNTPGAPINAGQVPEPGSLSLALLATGSAGLLAWRRRRREI
jgi:hypothetical protein